MEHKEVNALIERWAKKSAAERSDRKLVLHTEAATVAADSATQNSSRLRFMRWSVRSIVAAASIAAAIVAGALIFTTPEPEAPVICMVNGKRITDPAQVEQYTREAFELADENLRRPGATFTSMLDDDGPTMARVAEMLNELTKNQ
jgi:anti-sigma-K factor RskA